LRDQGFRVKGRGVKISGFMFMVEDSGFRVWVQIVGFRVPGFGFWVLGFRFWGFKV
jgi:hypothetical protein